MGSIITGILSFLGGPLLANLVAAYRAKLESVNSTDQKALELAVKDIETQLEARKQAVILGAGNRLAGFIQALFGLIGVSFVGKCVVWDTMLGLGSTPSLHGDVATYMTLTISFFMGGQILTTTVATVARRFGK